MSISAIRPRVRGFVVEWAFVLFPALLLVCVCDMNPHKSLTSLVALAAAAAVRPVLISVSAGSLSNSQELVVFGTTKVTLTNSHRLS